MNVITAEMVREMLHYDPQSGLFFHKLSCGAKRAGNVAGGKDHAGYVRINIRGKKYAAHRLVWLYMHGSWPKEEIDHINRNKSDNRFVNLREATRPQNLANSVPRKKNSTGMKGARPHGKSFQSQITFMGKTRHLGTFPTAEEAHAAYINAARKYFGEFARP